MFNIYSSKSMSLNLLKFYWKNKLFNEIIEQFIKIFQIQLKNLLDKNRFDINKFEKLRFKMNQSYVIC